MSQRAVKVVTLGRCRCQMVELFCKKNRVEKWLKQPFMGCKKITFRELFNWHYIRDEVMFYWNFNISVHYIGAGQLRYSCQLYAAPNYLSISRSMPLGAAVSVQLKGDPGVDPELAGGIKYLIWPANASGSARSSWKALLWRGMPGIPSLACCHRDPPRSEL